MAIPDWLNVIKDKFTDAASYAITARHVELLESHVDMLRSQVEALTANLAEKVTHLDEARERLAALETENAKLGKDNARFREREKFDEIAGIAFKRTKKKGDYHEEPRCPDCHRHFFYHCSFSTSSARSDANPAVASDRWHFASWSIRV